MPPRPKPIYQVTINNIGEWAQLSSKGLDVVVDPLVFRLGQLFLEGKQGGPDRWPAIESDIGAVVAFFDLLVLHDQLPAFNYPDTFYTTDTDYSRDEQDLTATWEARDGLGKVLNTRGDQTLVHVDIEHIMYREAKAAAIHQLAMRLHEGPIASEAATVEILKMLDAVKYGWEPRLEE